MELRSMEQDLDELAALYRKLQRHWEEDQQQTLIFPTLETTTTTPPADNNSNNNGETNDAAVSEEVITDDDDEPCFESWTGALQALESIQERLVSLEAAVNKLQKRLQQTDPVTNKPRYGAKTAARVQAMLHLHEQLQTNVNVLLGEEQSSSTTTISPSVADRLRQRAALEQEAIDRENQALKEQEERKEKELQELQAQRERQQLEAEEAARQEAERQRQLARQQVEEARLAQQRQAEMAAQADREWLASIPNKGHIEGVKQQLEILLQSTSVDKADQQVALNSLHALFQQIVAHPEDSKLRRIRRDHAKFHEHVGRHDGGKEVLIAAGFEPGIVDDVPSLVLVEPDLEVDFDRWTAWFDLLKASLELIQQHM